MSENASYTLLERKDSSDTRAENSLKSLELKSLVANSSSSVSSTSFYYL